MFVPNGKSYLPPTIKYLTIFLLILSVLAVGILFLAMTNFAFPVIFTALMGIGCIIILMVGILHYVEQIELLMRNYDTVHELLSGKNSKKES